MRRRITRRGQAGAVMVEALIVGLLLTQFFAGGLYLFALYQAKLDTLYAAREAAWTSTMSGCGLRPWRPWASPGGLFKTAWNGDSIGFLVELFGGEDVVVETREIAQPAHVSTTTSMGCNETPHDLGTRRNPSEWMLEMIRSEFFDE